MLKIYGHSDDIVELDGIVEESIQALANDVCVKIGDEKAGGIWVYMTYDSLWTAAVSLIDENIPIPWPVLIKGDGHTIVVEIMCPKGTKVKAEAVTDG